MNGGGRGAVAHPDRQYCFITIWQPEARYVNAMITKRSCLPCVQ